MKVGILGAGNIAVSMVTAMNALETVSCVAVASRNLEKAEEFARKHHVPKAYGSYEQMLRDEDVELVYVATPHSHHYEHMKLCLEHGKHVLCEKAFTMNAEQAKQITGLAKAKGLLVAEAIWTRYMPSRRMIDELLGSGIIGRVNTLTANLSYVIDHKERIQRPELAGGALLDIGVYGLNFALMHFGWDIERMDSSVKLTDTGVDAMESITLHYRDGRMAVLTHSIYARSDRKGIFHGEKGYMVVENINNPQLIRVYDLQDRLILSQAVPEQINGYEYQLLECASALKAGKGECDSMPLAETVRVMELMDSLRKEWHVVYPGE